MSHVDFNSHLAFISLSDGYKRLMVSMLWLRQVGRKLWVCISFAREIRGNIVISEKDAWVSTILLHLIFLYCRYSFVLQSPCHSDGYVFLTCHLYKLLKQHSGPNQPLIVLSQSPTKLLILTPCY